MKFMIFLLALVAMPTAASAEWREAQSTHFIVYSNGGEAEVRAASERLEKYDFLLRFVSKVTAPPSPVKVKVYMVEDVDAVQRSMYGGGGSVLGYYNTVERGPFAVMPRGKDSENVLFHEYTHHFMFQYFPATYPTWYTEGFAEYYGTARIRENDLIEVGQPAQDRYSTFATQDWLPVAKLLTARSYADVPGDQIFNLYAEGWLLVHYLGVNQERGKQLSAYLGAINGGKSYKEATEIAFGPGARDLDSALHSYSRQRRLSVLQLQFKPIDTGPIRIRLLTAGEAALIPQEIKLERGILARESKDFADEVRGIARRYPDDPHALEILASAERRAGNGAAAAAAVDHWLALRPSDAGAQLAKAELEIDALAAAGTADGKAWAPVRQRLIQADRAHPNDPFILEAYYDSFTRARVLPPVGAQNALFHAFEILPQADTLRYKVAYDFEQRGMIEDAIDTIKPAAFQIDESAIAKDPKKKAKQDKEEEKYRLAGTPRTESAREMLARLEAKLANQPKKSG